MAWRSNLSKNFKELRILFSPSDPASSSTRQFIDKNYKDVKKLNPKLPILIREAANTDPQLWARHGIQVGAQHVMMICRFVSRAPWSRRFFSTDADHHLANTISELNKEMESVFGEPPASSFAGSTENHAMTMDFKGSQNGSEDFSENKSVSGLTHIDSKGEAQMVDVSLKEVSKRVAVASCKVVLGREVFDLVASDQTGKGDVLGVAKIAGISGAKQTSNLIPLCHNINLTHVRVDLSLNPRDFSVDIEGEAASTGKTGVEMEAMAAVTVAGLTVYDMCMAVSKQIQITNVQLEHKAGGKSGDWRRKNR